MRYASLAFAFTLLLGVVASPALVAQENALPRIKPKDLLERVEKTYEVPLPSSLRITYINETDYEDWPELHRRFESITDLRVDGERLDNRSTQRTWEGAEESVEYSERYFESIWDGNRLVHFQSPRTGVDAGIWYAYVSWDTAQKDGMKRVLSGRELSGVFPDGDEPYFRILRETKRLRVEIDTTTIPNVDTYHIEGTGDHGHYEVWVDPAKQYHLRKAIVRKEANHIGWNGQKISEYDWMAKTEMEFTLTDVEFGEIDGQFLPIRAAIHQKTSYVSGTQGWRPNDTRLSTVTRESIPSDPTLHDVVPFVPAAPDGVVVRETNGNPRYVWTDGTFVDDEARVAEAAVRWNSEMKTRNEKWRQANPVTIYDENADGRELVENALSRAREEGKRVLITWGANWCGWCRSLDQTFSDYPEIRDQMSARYVSVHIDLGHRDKHLDLALEYGLDFDKLAIPRMTILDANGAIVSERGSPAMVKPASGTFVYDALRIAKWLEESWQ